MSVVCGMNILSFLTWKKCSTIIPFCTVMLEELFFHARFRKSERG